MDPSCELAELLQRERELAARGLQDLGDGARVGPELRLREAKRERERDETLLGPVVEIPLQTAALFVSGGDDPAA
jgi:hypothetical protein